MVRVTMIMLCFLLAAAAAGRYQAEVSVREARKELRDLERAKAEELSQIQVLRAEIAYLESPERLAKIASKVTELRPLSADQLLTAEEMLATLGGAPSRAPEPQRRPDGDVILHALAMADIDYAE